MAKKQKKRDSVPPDAALSREEVRARRAQMLDVIGKATKEAFDNPTIEDIVRQGVADGIAKFLQTAFTRKGSG